MRALGEAEEGDYLGLQNAGTTASITRCGMEDCSCNADPSFSRNNGKNGSEESTRASRDAWLIPPFFGELTRCLALILGESLYSRRTPGLDRKAKLAIISAKTERPQGRVWSGS